MRVTEGKETAMRRVALCLWIAVYAAAAFWSAVPAAPVLAAPEGLGVHAETAALIDVASGRLLYGKAGDKRMRIASLTKIMTAIVAIESGKLSDQVKVSAAAYGKEGSSVYLKSGEEISLHHLLYGLMLRSGNDAAAAIAEHVGGSEEGFVLLMNRKAQELGLDGTHFMNPHGLDHAGHYSTANDLAKLTAYALHNPVFQEIVKTGTMRVPNPEASWDRIWNNKNKMLSIYQGADGVKTGYTKLSKRCLVSSATRSGQQLAAVTLNDPDDWSDHSRMLDWGFRNFKLQPLAEKGETVEAGFVTGNAFKYALAAGEASQVTRKAEWTDRNSAAFRLGTAGKLVFLLNGKPIGSVAIYPEGSPFLNTGRDADGRQTAGVHQDFGGSRFGTIIRALLSALFGGERQVD